jgi:hypothetical protein
VAAQYATYRLVDEVYHLGPRSDQGHYKMLGHLRGDRPVLFDNATVAPAQQCDLEEALLNNYLVLCELVATHASLPLSPPTPPPPQLSYTLRRSPSPERGDPPCDWFAPMGHLSDFRRQRVLDSVIQTMHQQSPQPPFELQFGSGRLTFAIHSECVAVTGPSKPHAQAFSHLYRLQGGHYANDEIMGALFALIGLLGAQHGIAALDSLSTAQPDEETMYRNLHNGPRLASLADHVKDILIPLHDRYSAESGHWLLVWIRLYDDGSHAGAITVFDSLDNHSKAVKSHIRRKVPRFAVHSHLFFA